MYGKVQAVPQVEFHPFLAPQPLRRRQGISAYLGDGELPRKLQHPCQQRAYYSTTRAHAVAKPSSPADTTRAVARHQKTRPPERTSTSATSDARRDGVTPRKYVEGMWLMLQQDEPGDYILATNETHTVRDFCREAFAHAGLDWEQYVKYDARYERPAEVDLPPSATRQSQSQPRLGAQKPNSAISSASW